VGEARLKLVIANLLIARCALWASATAAHKRNRDAISDFPLAYIFANRRDYASKFMAGHVRRVNIRVVSNPPVPVAAANARRHNLDHYAMRFGRWIGNILELWRDAEGFVNDSFHQVT
jgi:hypothetical protein